VRVSHDHHIDVRVFDHDLSCRLDIGIDLQYYLEGCRILAAARVQPLPVHIRDGRHQFRSFRPIRRILRDRLKDLGELGIEGVKTPKEILDGFCGQFFFRFGARNSDVVRLVLQRGVRLVASALAFGLVGTLGATPVLQDLPVTVRPPDPMILVPVGVLLTMLALVACFVPARRAARVDPMSVLRSE
jgi:hypothetical protein